MVMPEKEPTDHDRLVKIETQIETVLLQHENRISRLENGLVGVMVALLISVFGSLVAWFIAKR